MRTVLQLIRKDLKVFFHDRVAVLLTFVVPLVLIWVMGQAFGVGRASQGPTGIRIAVARLDTDPAYDALVQALRDEPAFKVLETWKDKEGVEHPYDEARIRSDLAAGTYRFGLLLPAAPSTPNKPGIQLRLLLNARNEIETQTVTGLLQKTIFTGAPKLFLRSMRLMAVGDIGDQGTREFYAGMAGVIGEAFGLDAAELERQMLDDAWIDEAFAAMESSATGGEAGEGIDFFAEIFALEQEQVAGLNVGNAVATRSVGGWGMMFLLFSLSGAAASLFDERKAGLFLRLLSYPVSRAHVLWSKYLFFIGLGVVQLLLVFSYSWLLYRIEFVSHLPALLIACLCASAACTAFGMLLAALSPSPAVASGLGTLLILSMSAIGGAWFPTSFMPEFIQVAAKFTVVYWSQEAFLRVLWEGKGILDLLPVIGPLVAMTAVLLSVTLWRFRRGDLFG